MSKDEVRIVDRCVYRFGRLQDTIGTRLLLALLQLMQERQDEVPFIEKLNRAEKLDLIPGALKWLELREILHLTAH